MPRLISVFLWGITMLSVSAQAWASDASTPAQADRQAAFRAWRQDIPDYEMRLYGRLQQVNRTQVSAQRTVAAALVVIVFAGGWAAWRLSRKGGAGPSPFTDWRNRRWRRRLENCHRDLLRQAKAAQNHDAIIALTEIRQRLDVNGRTAAPARRAGLNEM